MCTRTTRALDLQCLHAPIVSGSIKCLGPYPSLRSHLSLSPMGLLSGDYGTLHSSLNTIIGTPMQGAPQFVSIELPTKAVVEEIHVKFQGGFAGRECALMAGCSEARLEEVEQFYPKDSNSLQVSFSFTGVKLAVT